MDKGSRISITERILNLNLEIIYLLTGEEYTVVKKSSFDRLRPSNRFCESGGLSRTQKPQYLIHERNNYQKILELTNKIIQLLTGEVPVGCRDVTVYSSMEEWEYLEGHKDLYKTFMMDNHQFPKTLDGSGKSNTPERCPSLSYAQDCKKEEEEEEEYDSSLEKIEDLNIVVVDIVPQTDDKEELYVKTKEEEIPTDISTDCKMEDQLVTLGFYGGNMVTQQLNTMVSNADMLLCHPKNAKSVAGGLDILNKKRKHREEKTFICTECGKQFPFKSVFIKHQRVHTGEKPYTCPECGKCFSQKGSLVEHQRIHKGEKPFICSDCGKCFIQRANLYHHQKNHMEEKPFKCLECGKCFINNSRLVAHQRIHSGYKPFSCPDCGKCFIKNANLVIHRRVHTGEKPFVCSECGKCFIKNSNLVTHMRVHTGEKPFQCTKCGKCFSQSSVLVRHQKIHGNPSQNVINRQ